MGTRRARKSQDPWEMKGSEGIPHLRGDLENSRESAGVPKDRPQNVKAVFVTSILPRSQSEVYPHFPSLHVKDLGPPPFRFEIWVKTVDFSHQYHLVSRINQAYNPRIVLRCRSQRPFTAIRPTTGFACQMSNVWNVLIKTFLTLCEDDFFKPYLITVRVYPVQTVDFQLLGVIGGSEPF